MNQGFIWFSLITTKLYIKLNYWFKICIDIEKIAGAWNGAFSTPTERRSAPQLGGIGQNFLSQGKVFCLTLAQPWPLYRSLIQLNKL